MASLSGEIWVLAGQMTGGFAEPELVYDANETIIEISVADLNGDGRVEIAATETFLGNLLILPGQNP